jgi:hypothetical protein
VHTARVMVKRNRGSAPRALTAAIGQVERTTHISVEVLRDMG